MILHAFDRLGLAMHEKSFVWWVFESAQPLQNFAVVAVGRETIDDMNLSADRIIDSENPDLPGAFGKEPAARAICLKPDEYDRVPLIGKSLDHVVKDSSSRGHAVCRNDN